MRTDLGSSSCRGRHDSKRVKIPFRGSGPEGVRSTWLAWGALGRATGQSGAYHPGDLVKREAANSSTTKGP